MVVNVSVVTSKQIAVAAEAFNKHRGLTPAARRVGLEILNAMDKRTGVAWRSVRGIATRLDLAQRTIGYALRELRELGLIHSRPHGGKGLSIRVNFSSLSRTANMIKRSVAKKMSVPISTSRLARTGRERRSAQDASHTVKGMKPIETAYKGYRFRSRIEARWAVFFDAICMKWEYEPEGFDLGDGVRYLPDFRLTWADSNGLRRELWVEIKPEGGIITLDEEVKHQRFAEALAHDAAADFIVAQGLPTAGAFSSNVRNGGSWAFKGPGTTPVFNPDTLGGSNSAEPPPELLNAVAAARGARFEFAEAA